MSRLPVCLRPWLPNNAKAACPGSLTVQVQELLGRIEAGGILPPLVVLQASRPARLPRPCSPMLLALAIPPAFTVLRFAPLFPYQPPAIGLGLLACLRKLMHKAAAAAAGAVQEPALPPVAGERLRHPSAAGRQPVSGGALLPSREHAVGALMLPALRWRGLRTSERGMARDR